MPQRDPDEARRLAEIADRLAPCNAAMAEAELYVAASGRPAAAQDFVAGVQVRQLLDQLASGAPLPANLLLFPGPRPTGRGAAAFGPAIAPKNIPN